MYLKVGKYNLISENKELKKFISTKNNIYILEVEKDYPNLIKLSDYKNESFLYLKNTSCVSELGDISNS